MASRHRLFSGLAVVLAACLTLLPVLTHAPNRLLSGRPIGLDGFPVAAQVVLILALIVLFAAGLSRRGRLALAVILVVVLAVPAVYLVAAGATAARFAATEPALARTAIGAGGWLILGIAYLSAAEAVRRLGLRPAGQAGVVIAGLVPLVALGMTGSLDQLALIKEWAVKRDVFAGQLIQHAVIVGAALVPTVLLGLPLGVWAHRSLRVRTPLLTALGLIQTIPSIALFGLLMAPLSALSQAFPDLAAIGIRGIGLTPAVIALTAYALLPVVRNTVEGLSAVPEATLDAATGLGLTAPQRFFMVEVPLALPVIIAGLRITVVQTVGLAAVAALIGAGGLGALMFQGLFSNAGDLILLGALPIMLLAVAVDIVFRLAAASLTRSLA